MAFPPHEPSPAAQSRASQTASCTVAIVGNAPGPADMADAIDAHDIVVRINTSVGYGAETGARVDELVLVNSGGQMEEWLRLRTIERAPVFRAARTVRLPLHPRKIDSIAPPLTQDERRAAASDDYTEAATRRFRALGKRVRLYPPRLYPDCVAALGHAPYGRDTPAPSTGLVVVRWWLRLSLRRPVRCTAYNFGFSGWSGHDFAAEAAWFERAAKRGELALCRTRRRGP